MAIDPMTPMVVIPMIIRESIPSSIEAGWSMSGWSWTWFNTGSIKLSNSGNDDILKISCWTKLFFKIHGLLLPKNFVLRFDEIFLTMEIFLQTQQIYFFSPFQRRRWKCIAIHQRNTFGRPNYPNWLGCWFHRGSTIWTRKIRRPSPRRIQNRFRCRTWGIRTNRSTKTWNTQ